MFHIISLCFQGGMLGRAGFASVQFVSEFVGSLRLVYQCALHPVVFYYGSCVLFGFVLNNAIFSVCKLLLFASLLSIRSHL